jgi:ribose transport system substrate-binding protein
MRSTPRFRSVVLSLGAVALLGATLSACSSDSESSGSSGSGEKTIAFVTPQNTGPFYGNMRCGAQDAAKKAGVKLQWQGTASTETAEEMQVLTSVMATKPAGLVMTVWDNTAFNNVAKQYMADGAPLVMSDSTLSDNSEWQSIRTDSFGSSRDAAAELAKDIGSGSVLILTDKPGNQIQMDRAKGFKEGIEKNTELKVEKLQYVGSDAAKATSVLSSSIAANSDIKLVFATNDAAGTGAANALRSAGKSEDITLVGYDTSPSQIEELKKGDYKALIAQSPYQMGFESVKLVAEALKGSLTKDAIDEKTVYTPWKIVTADNVDSAEAKKFIYTAQCN